MNLMARCKGCDAEIFFAKTASGKLMPLNLEPVEPGANRYLLVRTPTIGVPLAISQSKMRELVGDQEVNLYETHWACPAAEQFR
jgi:hypothetical protein